ncbi:hypothetical protein [Actinoplanes sp. NPDC051851]|uniref:hypothetical protein n=1 Tax=Actinoplanes sp. NPDC051851 TaxID=3154753 RepID=UPI0034161322
MGSFRSRTAWFGALAVGATLAAATVHGVTRPSPEPAEVSAPSPSATPTGGIARVPDLSVRRLTEAWTTRWKTEPTDGTTGGGRMRYVVMTAPTGLRIDIYSLVEEPDPVVGIICTRKGGAAPATEKSRAELVDDCLRNAVSDDMLDAVTDWSEKAELTTPKRYPDGKAAHHQFTGYTASILLRNGALKLFMTGGTFFDV